MSAQEMWSCQVHAGDNNAVEELCMFEEQKSHGQEY